MKLLLGLAFVASLAALGAAQESHAQLRFDPTSAQVGEPVRASLVFEHASAQHPTLESLGQDDSWVVFGAHVGHDVRELANPDRTTTTWVFEIASLEPGERTLANIPLRMGDDKPAVEVAPLAVKPVLAEAEDVPRALRSLRDIETPEERASLWIWIGGAVALGCALAVVLSAWWIRRKPAPLAVSAPSVRLALLETKPLDTADDVQAAHRAMTRLLRESADLRIGRDRIGLTDEEWRVEAAAQFDAAGLDDAERRLLEQLFRAAVRVKYGGDRPTHWATREALAQARSLALRFEAPIASVPDVERKQEVAA